MTTKPRFELHFAGQSNAGLRRQIRATVSGHRCGPANSAAILTLARTVALTASGTATLERVAADYATIRPGYQPTCDCAACYAGNLQALGANG